MITGKAIRLRQKDVNVEAVWVDCLKCGGNVVGKDTGSTTLDLQLNVEAVCLDCGQVYKLPVYRRGG